jgi:ABC-type sulfate/molybdate transport systems ATPase subunit
VWERHVHFGHSIVAGAHAIPDGEEAVAYIRPHDVQITADKGERSFPVAVERRTDMGWMSKLHLRLEDGQPLVAQLPNEEIDGVAAGQNLFANLRNPKVFPRSHSDETAPVSEEVLPVGRESISVGG